MYFFDSGDNGRIGSQEQTQKRYVQVVTDLLFPVVVTSLEQVVITLLQGWWRYFTFNVPR